MRTTCEQTQGVDSSHHAKGCNHNLSHGLERLCKELKIHLSDHQVLASSAASPPESNAGTDIPYLPRTWPHPTHNSHACALSDKLSD
jgi:hypothetical protein